MTFTQEQRKWAETILWIERKGPEWLAEEVRSMHEENERLKAEVERLKVEVGEAMLVVETQDSQIKRLKAEAKNLLHDQGLAARQAQANEDGWKRCEARYVDLRDLCGRLVDALDNKMHEYRPHDPGYCGDCDNARAVLAEAREKEVVK